MYTWKIDKKSQYVMLCGWMSCPCESMYVSASLVLT